MLIKLIKHDILSTYRHILPVYFAGLIVAILGGLSTFFNNDRVIPFILLQMVFVGIGLVFASIVIWQQLFYKRLFTAEAYLTRTFPVSTQELFLSKMITTMFWTLTTIVVAILGFLTFALIVSFSTNAIPLIELFTEYRVQIMEFVTELSKMAILAFPHFLVSSAYSISMVLFAIVFANSSFVPSKLKVVVGIVLFIGINFVVSNISNNIQTFTWMSTMMNTNTISSTQMFNFNYQINWLNYILSFSYDGILAAALFFGSVWLNDHKLEII